jgi:type II secretory pathway pseudopilin PulG
MKSLMKSLAKPTGAGFTLIEVLISALVLGIGLIGILAMQTTVSLTNRGAYDRQTAMTLAETTLERIKRDGIEWTPSNAAASDSWLAHAVVSADGQWAQPPLPVGASNQPTYNDMMLPNVSNEDIPSTMYELAEKNSRYCIEYQIGWVVTDELARVDVRVSWARNREGAAEMAGTCAVLGGISDLDRAAWFRDVRVTGMVRRNDLNEDNSPGS